MLGTYENFKKTVSQKPYILHITCHGDYYDPKETMTENRKGNLADSMLIFEKESGYGNEIDKEKLFINDDSMKGIMLIFVAACKSDRIGQMFQDRGGVRHVICSDIEIDDSTTCEFTKAFYAQIFKGESIC